MKKLILFIFILVPMIGFSQNANIWGIKIVSFNETNPNFTSKTEYATLYLIDRLEAYFKDCYNDSTYHEYWYHPKVTPDPKTGMSCAIYYPPELIKEYTHKEPTLKGFHEWLKKSVENKDIEEVNPKSIDTDDFYYPKDPLNELIRIMPDSTEIILNNVKYLKK